MLDYLDRLLDKVTMYRLLIYYLSALVIGAGVFSGLDYLNYNPMYIAAEAFGLAVLCWLLNKLFGRGFKIPVHAESAIITGLILTLIINPPKEINDFVFPAVAGMLAIASKFILAFRGKHIFNPAAIAVLLTSVFADQSATWWIGNKYMWPLVLAGGLLLVRKIEREYMVGAFLATALASTVGWALINDRDVSASLKATVLHSSLLFLAFVMLVEPATSPTRRQGQVWYGALTGFLFSPQVHIGNIYSTPERALVISNIFAFIINPKWRQVLHLKQKTQVSGSVYDFVFQPTKPLNYLPGQYLEWTLPHKQADSRGQRRYFTLASSPTEKELRLGLKFYEPGSSFKRAIKQLDSKKLLAAGQLSGDFTLPKDKTKKLVFIAGGIGVTPYRSMIKYLIDKQEQRDIILIYSEKQANDFAYQDIFSAGRTIGLKTIYTVTDPPPPGWKGQTGVVSAEMIKSRVPDWQQRTFYLSGPHPMTIAIKKQLKILGMPDRQIKIDFFPGYA